MAISLANVGLAAPEVRHDPERKREPGTATGLEP